MIQIIFGLFCIVFGATAAVMKREQMIYILLKGKSYRYEEKLTYLNKFILVLRILSGLVAVLGTYILIASVCSMIVEI